MIIKIRNNMISKKIKKIIATSLLILGTFSLVFSAAVISNNAQQIKTDANNTYSLSLNKGISVDSNNYGEVTISRGTTFGFKLSNYTAGSNTLGTLSSGGEILNYTAINGIQSIVITITSGSLNVYYGWKQYTSSEVEYASESSLTLSSSGTQQVSLSNISPSYFKVVATSQTNISNITVNYSCSEATVIPNLRVTVAQPTISSGSSSTITSNNYLWICTNLEDSSASEWPSYVMTKNDDGSWYCDFTNVAVSDSGYGYTLVVCDSNTTIGWTYQMSEATVLFGVGAGQSELNIDTVHTFSGQPTVISSSYTLNLTINMNGTIPSTFGNIQFVYNYTNSTTNYTWGHQISSSGLSSYSYQISGLDTSTSLYFKLYIWDRNIGDCYIGDSSGANWVLNPTGSSSESATITFTYPTSASTVGTCVIDSGSQSGSMSFDDQITTVYGNTITIAPTFSGSAETFTASYSGENIRIDDNLYITGLKAGTTTKVTLTSYSGLTCSFNVTVSGSSYAATSTRDDMYPSGSSTKASVSEGWFTSTSVSQINGMGSDFFNGVDISSAKALYDNGSKFYNASGEEQSLFYILKDGGVNWVRLKLWVDPQSSNGISYGGGNSNLSNTLWMAKEAKAAGMKFLLDFHYSDYWTHPGQQIIPKSWNSCNNASSLQSKIKSYTTEVLQNFQNNNCLPNMVQLGNEISSGIYLQKYSGSSESLDSYGQPSYLTGKSSYSYGTTNWSDYTNYIKAAYEGVNAVDSSIKKVLHWAKGSSISASIINSFFSSMPSTYYDYAAISFYPFYCFDSMSVAQSILNGLSISKPWFVAETSYPFSGSSYVYENGADVTQFTISNWNTGDTNIKNSYAFNSSGQANLIHDLTAAVVSAGGKGVFYWEPAWIPNSSVGWAGSGSLCTWSNQGFFSYDGKALANLDLFAQMSPYI